METLIKKSIEGGYNASWDIVCGAIIPDGKGGNHVGNLYPLLDPLFFQALGKACGWEKNQGLCNCFHFKEDHKTYGGTGLHKSDIINCLHCECKIYREKVYIHWKYVAIRFHELNLIEGFDPAISYLVNLVKE